MSVTTLLLYYEFFSPICVPKLAAAGYNEHDKLLQFLLGEKTNKTKQNKTKQNKKTYYLLIPGVARSTIV